MRFIKISRVVVVFFLIIFLISSKNVSAVDCQERECGQDNELERAACIADNISCLNQKIEDAQSSATTLKSTIEVLSSQINIFELEIDESLRNISNLESEIKVLNGEIQTLEGSLDQLSNSLVTKVIAQYKRSFVNPLLLLVSRQSLNSFMSDFQYLKTINHQTTLSLHAVEQQKNIYTEQKELKQQKQDQLEQARIKLNAQKVELNNKRKVQEQILDETNSSEAAFQEKLSQEIAEYLSIQAICSGKGNETEIRKVNSGEKIASIIQGKSCNSSGTHLHFSVRETRESPIDSQTQYFCSNPFSFLKSDIDYVNCTTSFGCNIQIGDPFAASGSWDWPIKPQVFYFQGYGVTWSVQNVGWLPYDFHDGLDINSKNDNSVYAVQSGTLFEGSYYGIDGCQLKYVRVDHDDSNIDSLYLHTTR